MRNWSSNRTSNTRRPHCTVLYKNLSKSSLQRAASFVLVTATPFETNILSFFFFEFLATERTSGLRFKENVRSRKKQTKMGQSQQAVYNRRHNSTHATTTTAQPAIKAAHREATQKRNSPPHNHLHDARKNLRTTFPVPCFYIFPSETFDHIFLQDPNPHRQSNNRLTHGDTREN